MYIYINIYIYKDTTITGASTLMIPTPFQSLKTLRVSRQDFTSISEELKQDDLILLLTVYLSVMTRIIEPGPRRASPGRSERCLRKNGKGHGVDVFWEKIIRHVCIYIYIYPLVI